jgi:hypothetical protein
LNSDGGPIRFKTWISSRPYFGETEVVTEIKKRPQMACLLGYTILMPSPDLYKFEFGINTSGREVGLAGVAGLVEV